MFSYKKLDKEDIKLTTFMALFSIPIFKFQLLVPFVSSVKKVPPINFPLSKKNGYLITLTCQDELQYSQSVLLEPFSFGVTALVLQVFWQWKQSIFQSILTRWVNIQFCCLRSSILDSTLGLFHHLSNLASQKHWPPTSSWQLCHL